MNRRIFFASLFGAPLVAKAQPTKMKFRQIGLSSLAEMERELLYCQLVRAGAIDPITLLEQLRLPPIGRLPSTRAIDSILKELNRVPVS